MAFTEQQATEAAKALGVDFGTVKFTAADFLRGMDIELEHGTVSTITNLTDDEPVKTAKIVLAHLNETPRYYDEKAGVQAWETSLKKGVKSKSKKTEYKTLKFELEDFDDEQGIFSGYAAVFGNVDSGGDVIEPGAFTKTIAEGTERVKILALHNDYDLPIGKPIELREDSHGLYIKGKISETAAGKDVRTLLRDRVLNEMSIGYDPVTFDYDKDDGIRHLREVKLWEVSIVAWGMNPEAVITGYKAAEAADRAKQMADETARDLKEGRKISRVRLKTLNEACDTLESAIKALRNVIKEAEGGNKSAKRLRPPEAKNLPTTGSSETYPKRTIEITFD